MPLKDGSPEDYAAAAARHYQDACSLSKLDRRDGAGHLIGFAAECAIKHRIDLVDAADNPQLHLPDLLPAARRRLGKRVNYTQMYNLIKDDIFGNWNVDHRYSEDGKVTELMLSGWIQITRRLLAAAGIKVSST